MLCNTNFITNFAYIDRNIINTTEYTEILKHKIKCCHGHELIFCNGEKKKSYFRHKNSQDVGGFPMTEWHCNWQSNFPVTEIEFEKKEGQIKNRRADVFIKEHNLVLEIQHSKIEADEIENRNHDYKLHNIKVIWLIDCNDCIKITELKNNRVFLEFIKDFWKYLNFICNDIIFLNIDNLIFKINPKLIKSHMIDVDLPITKEDFINLLNKNDNYLYNIDIPEQCNIYIKQQGAGNGKTYNAIQIIEDVDFSHYDLFIYISKQHSAKTVINEELKKQIEKKELKYIEIIDYSNENKKYKIKFLNNKTNKNCQIIIATVDSFMYAMGNKNNSYLNKFEGIVYSIVDGYCKENNTINYSGLNIKLNKKICLVCDETQDLMIDYAKAIIKIMRNTYIDCYIIGDKLQSITYDNNAFNYLFDNDFSYINKKLYEPKNICRRFTDPYLIKFVNHMIPFEKYKLPCIEYNLNDNYHKNSIEFIKGNPIRTNDDINPDKFILNIEVEKIMNYYDNEVKTNNYKPNDFLFIVAFTKKNPLASALELAINKYWNNYYNTDTFINYAIFHKSEEGSSINLDESKDATRIVSIHTSKGDGRNVVFVIDINENGILKYSNEDNLIYHSLIHVAFTRMKKKLYIRITDTDDISNRIYEFDDNICDIIEPKIKTNYKLNFNKLISLFNNDDFSYIQNNIIDKIDKIIYNDNNDEKILIDFGHHQIRYACMYISFMIKIIQNTNQNTNQFAAIFNKISNIDILKTSDWKLHNDYIQKNKISIYNYNNNGRDYIKYFDIMDKIMNKIKNKIPNIFSNHVKNLCPLETILLLYMIEIKEQGIYSSININDLYSIINIYSKSFTHDIKGHKNCLCKTLFDKLDDYIMNSNENKLHNYLCNHYQKITNTNKLILKFISEYNDINWLLNHKIYFNGESDDFVLHNTYSFIGYNDKNIYILYLKPQYNSLNKNEIYNDSIMDIYFIKNIQTPNNIKSKLLKYKESIQNNYEKFYNKNINIVIISPDLDEYKLYNFVENDINLIEYNSNYIHKKIKEKLFIYYEKYLPIFYNAYTYYYLKNKSERPNIIIKNIINEIKDNNITKDNESIIPKFVCKFLDKIQDKIDDCNDEYENIILLDKYNIKKNFIEDIKKELIKAINRYFDK